jgi:O-antigen/teichoic acid export membrane protein
LKIIKDVGSIGIADIIASGVGSIFWLYLASLLTAENYGEIQFYVSLAGMAFAFSMLGARNTIIVYEAKKIGLRRILFLISIIGGICASVVLWILYQRLDIISLSLGMIFGELAIGYFLGKKLFVKYAIFTVLQKILMVSLAIGFYFIIGIEGVIYGIGFSYIPFVLITLSNFRGKKIELKPLRTHYGFIINNYALILVGNAKGNLDKLLIAPLIGFGILGNYSIAFQVYLVLMVFTNIIYKYSLTHDASGIFSKKIKIFTIIISVIFSIIGIMIVPQIIPIYFPNFIDSIQVIPILSLAVIPNTISLLYSSKFLGDEKGKVILIGIIFNTSLYLILISFLSQLYSIQGIGISYLISSITYAIFLFIVTNYQSKINKYLKKK